ncbi:MAG TPA: hypothetical protein VN922_03520 [Bacteroidia bacterium]|nr:hypothetical protein [Bacteroidia bacterium]
MQPSLDKTDGRQAIALIEKYNLINCFSSKWLGSIIDITLEGDEMINAGGIESYIKKLETAEISKLQNTGHTNTFNINGNIKGNFKLEQNQNVGLGKQIIGKEKSFIEQCWDKIKALFGIGASK